MLPELRPAPSNLCASSAFLLYPRRRIPTPTAAACV
jgi:hypothetical protein